MGAKLALNILRGILGGVKEVDAESYRRQYDGTSHVILDVRNPQEYADAHIPGAINIPMSKLKKKMDVLPNDQAIVCVCRNGLQGREAAFFLQQNGYKVANILGGMQQWKRAGESIER